MSSDLFVSVVMSAYNGERFLREAAGSILSQSFRNFEFIIVNDGSTDATTEILESFRRVDPRVRVFHQENRGLVASLNRGCELARGEYIARMDADDIAVEDRLMWQVEFMERHPEVSVLGGAAELIDHEGRALRIHRHPVEDGEIRSALLHKNVVWHPTVLFRRKDFAAVGGYRNVLAAEDYDLWLRFADRFKLANLASVLLRYRVHPLQVSVQKNRQQALSALASRASALARRDGKPDPLESACDITPALLVDLAANIIPTAVCGLSGSTAAQQNALLRAHLRWIRDLCEVLEPSDFVRDPIEMLGSGDYRPAGRRAMAEVRLTIAQLYWKRARFARSAVVAGHAILTRPFIATRALNPLLRGLRLSWHQRT